MPKNRRFVLFGRFVFLEVNPLFRCFRIEAYAPAIVRGRTQHPFGDRPDVLPFVTDGLVRSVFVSLPET